jgi:uncharacterized SAM-binding protein YcdF (DUF218 family)
MFLLHLKTLLRALVLPPAAPLVLALFGLLVLRRRPSLARYCLVIGIGSLTLLSMPLVAHALTGLVERCPALNLAAPTGAQAIVILGGGGQRSDAPEYGGPAAKPVLLERLAYGAYLARRTALPVLITGFHVEARAMQATLQRNFDVVPRWVDDQAYDTFENARNAAKLLQAEHIQRIILVSSATHLWRASQEFAAAGLEVVPAPAGVAESRSGESLGVVPDADALAESRTALYELLGESVRQFFAVTRLRRQ